MALCLSTRMASAITSRFPSCSRSTSPGRAYSQVRRTKQSRSWQWNFRFEAVIEYGFKHAKNELGRADFRVTDYPFIERWWELVSCAHLLVSVQSPVFQHANDESEHSHLSSVVTPPDRFAEHRWWDSGQGWKNILNNLRLIL